MTELYPETNLERKDIAELCFGKEEKRLRFHIPSYQRGYRWTNHVTKLMDDIYEFAESKKKNLDVGSFYCLQPIIMKRREALDNVGIDGQAEIGYEVVDGQQRLTTILILLTVLGHSAQDGLFRISYERDANQNEERETFLRNVASKKETDCNNVADFYYIHLAYNNAQDWLKQKTIELRKSPRLKLLWILLEKVKVIWYELPDDKDGSTDTRTNARELFRNINAGKIKLTDAELVKAMMLNSKHYPKDNSGQERIARVWDDCGRFLQDDAFWGFISCDPRPRSQRMDFLLELYRKKTTVSDKDTVSAFYERLLTSIETIQYTWREILELFRKIQDWFGDISLYNYIGLWVRYRGVGKKNTLLDLINESPNHGRSEFRKSIIDAFKQKIQITGNDFSRMNYNQHRTNIKWMLMLFNIRLMNKRGGRFNFEVEGDWSVEHVFARESKSVDAPDRKDWVERHLRVVKSKLKYPGKTSVTEISALLGQMEKYMKDDSSVDFNIFYENYFSLIETPAGTDIDNIRNLALLGLKDNESLKNDTFYDKREKIIEMIESGRNIPFGTERVFLKSFPDTSTSLDFWNEDDEERYLSYMQEIIFGQED